jgi:hypothetical protein
MRHPSTEHLAEYAEGVLSRRRSVKVSSHLGTGCTQCNGQIVQLRQVTSQLTSASMKFGPMPDQFMARIDTAIASESSARVTSAPVPGEASRRDLPVRGRGRQERRWRFPVFSSPLAGSLAAVGAAVVIAGGGYEIASHLGSSSPSPSSASATAPHSSSGLSQGSAAAAGAPVRFGPEIGFRHAGRRDSVHSVQTATNYSAASLIAQARALLAVVRERNIALANQAMTSPYTPSATSSVISADQLRKCVARIAAGQDVLLVDAAKYQGAPAVVIVVGTPPDGPGYVYAVGSACSASSSDILSRQHLPGS